MTNFTKHFKIKEFNCKDGTPVPPQYLSNAKKVADNLEVLRAALGGKPIIITSGYRTPEHNKRVGGVGSYHGEIDFSTSAEDVAFKSYLQEKKIEGRKYKHYAWMREATRIIDPRSTDEYKNFKEELTIRKPK